MASPQKKRRAAAGRSKSDFFVWTDCEVELLLIVTNEYKISKNVKNVDWESCQTKYSDILDLYKQQYPSTEESEPLEGDYPHKLEEITKAILTTKLKAIRHKYRQALESGSRRTHGRVVLLYFDLCEQIWGGASVTKSTSETCDTEDRLDLDPSDHLRQYPTPSLSSPLDSDLDEVGGADMSAVVESSYRKERLKRRLPKDGRMVALAQEDLKIKKQILERMETFTDNMTRLTSSIEKLTHTVAEGFSMLRQMMAHPPYSSPPPYSYGHTQPRLVPPTSSPVPQHNGGHDSCTQNQFFDEKDNKVSAETSVQ